MGIKKKYRDSLVVRIWDIYTVFLLPYILILFSLAAFESKNTISIHWILPSEIITMSIFLTLNFVYLKLDKGKVISIFAIVVSFIILLKLETDYFFKHFDVFFTHLGILFLLISLTIWCFVIILNDTLGDYLIARQYRFLDPPSKKEIGSCFYILPFWILTILSILLFAISYTNFNTVLYSVIAIIALSYYVIRDLRS